MIDEEYIANIVANTLARPRCGSTIGGVRVRVLILGPFRVERDGEEVRIPARKDRAMLAEVARRGRMPRDEAIALLWPDSDEARARDSLRHSLWRLRSALGDDVVSSDGDELRIGGHVQVDLRELETAVAAGTVAELARAVALYRGDLAKELEAADAEAERTRSRGLVADAARRAASALLPEDPAEAIAVARAALRHDPYREDLHRIVYEGLARSGDRAALSAEHRRVTALLRRELGVEPSAETRALYARLVTNETETREEVRARRPSPTAPSRLVGRGNEHRRVLEMVVDAMDGRGGALLVLGEAGAGKTALLEEAVRIAREHGLATVTSRAAGAEGQLAFQSWRDALRPHAAEAAGLPLPWPRILERLIPTGAGVADAGAVAPQVERARLFEGVARLLSSIAGHAPLLVVLDDVHWADVDSLHLLGYLVRTLRGARMAFLTAARLGANVDLDDLRAQLSSADLLNELELGAMDIDAVRQLLEHAGVVASTAHWLAPRLTDRTAGNPFFILESIRALTEQGLLRRAAGALEWHGRAPTKDEPLATQLPPGVRHTIAGRLRVLPIETRHLLGIASAIGRTFEPAVLAGATARDELVILDALEPALAARILKDDVLESRPALSFAHDLVRDATYQQLAPVMRAAIHRRVAVALEKRDAPAAVVAHHFSAASEPGRAVDHWLAAAAAAVGACAHEAALRAYGAALESLPAGDTERRLEIIERMGDVHIRRGVPVEAFVAYDQVLALARTTDIERITRVQVKIAYGCGRHYGEHPRAMEFAEAGVARYERTRPDTAEMADALVALMAMQYQTGDTASVVATGARVGELCRRLDLPRQEAAALSIEGWARYLEGRATYTPEPADADRLIARLGDDEEAAHLLAGLARPANRRGDFERALELATRANEIAVRVGSLRAEDIALEIAQRALVHLGRWRDAIEMSDRHIALIPISAHDVRDPLITRGIALSLTGAIDEARATARRVASLSQDGLGRVSPLHITKDVEAVLVYALADLPELIPSADELSAARPRCRTCDHGWLGHAGLAAGLSGDSDTALKLAQELEGLVSSSGYRAVSWWAPLIRSLARGGPEHDAAERERVLASRRASEIGDRLGLSVIDRLLRIRGSMLATTARS